MKYQSGENIHTGDKILYAGQPGEVKFIVEKLTGDPEKDWLMNEYGPGVMVLEPKFYENGTFVSNTEDAEDLVFVTRRV